MPCRASFRLRVGAQKKQRRKNSGAAVRLVLC
jgi:hypothetical protein